MGMSSIDQRQWESSITNFKEYLRSTPQPKYFGVTHYKMAQAYYQLERYITRKGELWPLVREHLHPQDFQTPHFKKLYERLLQLPDTEFQDFDPLKLKHTDPELFQSVIKTGSFIISAKTHIHSDDNLWTGTDKKATRVKV